MNFNEFLLWEISTRDTIDFKKAYVDICNDVLAGLMLSEIIYWHLPDKKGSENKLRIEKEGRKWIAVRRYEWWDRIRLSPRQADRAIAVLKELGVLETDVFKFYGEPTVHVYLNQDIFLSMWEEVVNNETVNPFSPNRENNLPETVKTKSRKKVNPLTESTAESTDISIRAKKKELTPAEMKEVVDEANKKVDAILGNEGIVAKLPKYNHRSDFPHDIQRLADKFHELTGIEPRKGKGANGNSPMAWLSEISSWVAAGYTSREIAVAHWLSKPNPAKRRTGFFVTQPASLSNMLSMVHGQFRNHDETLFNEYLAEKAEQGLEKPSATESPLAAFEQTWTPRV